MNQEEFELALQGRKVPGVLFLNGASSQPAPIVLTQHGGSSHKLGQEVLDLAEVFVERHGMAMVSIDGPVHGDRRDGGHASASREETVQDFFRTWRSPGNGIEDMIADWRGVIDWLCKDQRFDASAIGWAGVSMGTAYGLPLLAAEPRIKAAVIGMWGLSFDNSQSLAAAAAAVRCPLLFQIKWDDALFDRSGQISLFDKIGTKEKWLNVYPGGHERVVGQQMRDTEGFLVERLCLDRF